LRNLHPAVDVRQASRLAVGQQLGRAGSVGGAGQALALLRSEWVA